MVPIKQNVIISEYSLGKVEIFIHLGGKWNCRKSTGQAKCGKS